jgi:indole-3-glycerol phosphate synthase/phosphoribosylanthranilate isomerase
MSVRESIVEKRHALVRQHGHALGSAVPDRRSQPVVPFGAAPFLICEVKRRSPSRGDIAPGIDAVEQARLYAEQGVRSISVLTETESFGGSLEDLMRIKAAIPGLSVLRKDFLFDEEDIEVSWRAGADAVLLIASMLEPGMLAAMHRRALSLGIEALVELHDASDVAACRDLAPGLVGVNARDLATFRVDPLGPLALAGSIDWVCRLVFESGVRAAEDILLARGAGFSGVLVGEAVMKAPRMIPALLAGFLPPARNFWTRLSGRRRVGRPLVKVCGITRAPDAEKAAALGADMLGFVFAPSKRRAERAVLREVHDLPVLKVAVVVSQAGAGRLEPEVEELLNGGLIDAVQLHGEEQPEDCARLAFPYYKAMRVRGPEEGAAMESYLCPRVLADAYSPDAVGGTGRRIPAAIVRGFDGGRPLWLAGGIGPDNASEIIRELAPELIDASSGLEESPGRKDVQKLSRFFEEIGRHETV